MENVILVTFRDPGRASDGMRELRRLDDEAALKVWAAAIVGRAADGSFRLEEEAEDFGLAGSVVAGLIGAIVGSLAGPVGLLLGGTAGVAIGSITDAEEVHTADVLLTTMARKVPVGGTALVAHVDEPAVELLDAVMAPLGGTVVRRSRVQVEAELAAITERVAAAERAERERREQEGKETVGDRLADLKAKVTDRQER